MAAPQVVGQVGLIRSLNPALTRQEVFDIIINTTDNIDALNPSFLGQLGSGRINLRNSLQDLASTNFAADPIVGAAPMLVQFYDSSLTAPTDWKWYFGDGDSASEQNPSHMYGAGLFDVTLRTQTAIGTGVKIKVNFVAALAETLVTPDSVAELGEVMGIDIWATNNQPLKEIVLPLRGTNIPLSATFDSLVASGCRTEYFEYKQLVYDNRGNGAVCLRLRTDNNSDGAPAPLPAGTGPIARAWFTMKNDASPVNPITIDTATLGVSQYKLRFYSPVVDFVPTFYPGSLSVCVIPADLDFSGFHDVTDVVGEIDIVFRGAAFPSPPEAADGNCDSVYDIRDVVRVVEFAFRGVAASCCQ
jgi:PKD repeat protein